MDTAVAFLFFSIKAEEGAGFRTVDEGAPVREEGGLVGIDADVRPLSGILVLQTVAEVPEVLFDDMNEPKVGAAVSALVAFECQDIIPPEKVSVLCAEDPASPSECLPSVDEVLVLDTTEVLFHLLSLRVVLMILQPV